MKYSLLVLVFTILISCESDKKSEDVDYVAKNDQEIAAYIAENSLEAQKSNSGLYYVINEEGAGAQPTSTSNVTVAYTGYYLNDNVFDKSDANGISFGLNQVIKGWTEGIPYFKEGGNGILLVPAHLGYGNNNYSGIPGGSVLIFDVTLISVN
ncbi:peptidylprolyl isomerase [Sediminicola sp. YIK13]|uniref:FKBP-type peptidyl-prolyl cis-trans isomerase n=1 Tax=Sediminicola sp. YIK13 TaxID=1453352 RepID=UPI00071FAF62|nr:FKBP-type peptidyl-prolyl cis-trans isomerase [Sediminicola sp. YIK13]ALM09235.1 peptidylprolyl isomerase [Sediminicola sp. YIK13]